MIVIVGSGLAGLSAALKVSEHTDVLVVTKGHIADSNTWHAQGGIAVAIAGDDSPAHHAADTLAAGHGLCDPEAVRILTEDGVRRMREQIEAGTPFDRIDGKLSRALEAAHGIPRVLHSGGDATGAAIEAAMIGRIGKRSLQILEHTFLLGFDVRNGRVSGVKVIREGVVTTIAADAVILASGGAGQLFAHTTNPAVATGDGAVAAWRAGAVLADCEFFQFHPTSLAVPGNALISEAVRGAGAILRDENGRRFMCDAHPMAELAPRDVVAETIARIMREQDGRPVLLDATALGSTFAERFPSIAAACAIWGLDPGKQPLPVTPAAHYWMGGVRTDLDGRTSLPGLYAAGEVACTGVHGANRLASNSLLEAMVFGHRAACASLVATEDQDWPQWQAETVMHSVPPSTSMSGAPGLSDVQALMWSDVGISRNQPGLKRAWQQLSDWEAGFRADTASQRIPGVSGLELRNLATLGAIIARAALDRTESRGAHRRDDYPQAEPAQAWRRHYRYAEEAAMPSPAPAQSERGA